MSDKKEKLANEGALAGGTILTAGYYKAARDNAILSAYGKARRAKMNSERQKKRPVFDDEMDKVSKRREVKKAMDRWDAKQAHKHGVAMAKSTRGHKNIPVRGKQKGGKFKPSTLSQALRSDWAFKRAWLPKALLGKMPKFR